MKKIFLIFLTGIITSSCQQYTESISIQRNPFIKAEIDGENWQTTDYVSRYLGKIVYYEDENDVTGEIFNRISVTALSPSGEPDQLQLTIDVVNINNMVGEYNTTYTARGGINEVTWVDKATTPGFFPVYTLCQPLASSGKIIINRQEPNEKLITGTFEVTLCERTNSGQVLTIKKGEFKDLSYKFTE